MRKFLVLVLAFALLSAFKWGSEEETTTPKETPSYARPTYGQTVSSTKKAAPAAARTTDANLAVTQALGTDKPEELKTRVESLARVSRALQAMNAAKAQ